MKQFEIIWSDFAENELDEIFKYYSEVAGDSIAKSVIQNILSEPNQQERKEIYTEEFSSSPRLGRTLGLCGSYRNIE
jgi:plasmid stabilization system protein ParE